MMTKKIQQLVNLKKVIREMESDLGLTSLTSIEQSVLLAVSDMQCKNGIAKTKAILIHELTANISRPSIFRAIKKLEKHGKLIRVDQAKGEYLLNVST